MTISSYGMSSYGVRTDARFMSDTAEDTHLQLTDNLESGYGGFEESLFNQGETDYLTAGEDPVLGESNIR